VDSHALGSQLDDTAVASFLARFDDRVQQLARAALDALRALLPDGIESAEGGEIGIGDAAGYKSLVFTVSPQSTYVNVGIAGGASLDDPAGLLDGSGEVHRHLKIRRADELDDERVQAFLRQAVAARRPR